MKKLFALLGVVIIIFTISGCKETPKDTIRLDELQENEVAYWEDSKEPSDVKIETYQSYAQSIENPREIEGRYYVACGISSMQVIDSTSDSKWKELSKEELGEGIIKFFIKEDVWYANDEIITCRLKDTQGEYRYFSWQK